MRKILCATDLSSGADEALRQADSLARLTGASLEAIHVVPSPLRSYPLFPQLHQREASELPGLIERAAEPPRRSCRGGHRPDAGGSVPRGPRRRPLRRRRRARRGDGRRPPRRRGGRRHRGAPARRRRREGAAQRALPRPRRSRHGRRRGRPRRDRSLGPVSAGPHGGRTYGHAARRAAHGSPQRRRHGSGRRVRAGRTRPAHRPRESIRGAVSEARTHLLDALVRSGVAARTIVTTGDPAASILKAAAELPAGLLVIGTRGRTGLARLLLGSVASEVARSATCPVLAVRLGSPARDGP